MSRAVELAKKCHLGLFHDDDGSSLGALEAFYHAARAEALMEAAKSIESVDPFSFAIELLRDKANVEENQ